MNGIAVAVGVVFGFALAGARAHEYDVIRSMLLLQEAHLFLVMGSAVAVAAPMLWLLNRRRWQTPLAGTIKVQRSPVERKHVAGSLLFGSGWAVAGTCPGPALAMTAGGTLLGGVVMAGLFAGILLRDAMGARPTTQASEPAGAPAPAPTKA